jgi:Flp pilus assembly protein TadB
MASELPLFIAWPLLAFFIALPAAAAWRRRRDSREASEVAAELVEFAAAVRRESRCLPLDEPLRSRIVRLRVAEAASLQLAQELERGGASLLADAAQRLALRLRRRVAFDRKMLARTAPGLRRGAVAASLPPVVALLLHFVGADIPLGAQLTLLFVEAAGCALLWRVARVEI